MPLTGDALEQSIKQHQDDPFLILLTIEHDTLDDPIYLVRNRESVVSRGNTYTAFMLECELPTDTDEPPAARIAVQNVDRAIGQLLEGLIGSPTCTFEVILASDPDTVLETWPDLLFTDVTIDAGLVSATLSQEVFWQEPCPWRRLRPEEFPGMFEF